MKKLKILFITQEYSKTSCGGAGVFAYELTKALSKKNVEIHIITPGNINKITILQKNLFIHTFKTINLPLLRISLFYISVLLKANKIIKDFNIDIIHSNNYIGYWVNKNIPLVSTIHHLSILENENFSLLQKILNTPDMVIEPKVINKSNIVLNDSIYMYKEFIKKYPNAEKKFKYLPIGIDTKFYKNNNHNQLKSINDEMIIFHPGGGRAKRKGTISLINSLEQMPKNLNFKCIISGSSNGGNWKEELTNRINQSSVNKKIKLLGEVNYMDLPKYYNMSDIVVFPSIFEGFGFPVLEAMACNKPIIATKTGIATTIIEHEQNGILIDVNDEKNLLRYLVKLMTDNNFRNDISFKSRDIIEKKYDWEIIANKIINEYYNLL